MRRTGHVAVGDMVDVNTYVVAMNCQVLHCRHEWVLTEAFLAPVLSFDVFMQVSVTAHCE